jgi:hypothetical protein
MLRSMLGTATVDAIRAFADSSYKALLLRGVGLSTEVQSPINGFLPDAQCVLDFDLLHFGMLNLLGVRSHAVEYENLGKLVRNVWCRCRVRPAPQPAGPGADVEFSWHTDNPNWPFDDQASDVTRSVPNYLAQPSSPCRNQERGVHPHRLRRPRAVAVARLGDRLPQPAGLRLRRAGVQRRGYDGEQRNSTDPGARYQRLSAAFRRRHRQRHRDDARPPQRCCARCSKAYRASSWYCSPVTSSSSRTPACCIDKAFKPMPDGQARWLRRVCGAESFPAILTTNREFP